MSSGKKQDKVTTPSAVDLTESCAKGLVMNTFKSHVDRRFKTSLNFKDSAAIINDMIESTSLPALVKHTKLAITKIFRCETINFLFMEREAASIFREQGGKTEILVHSHFAFDYAVPESQPAFSATSLDQPDFEPKFRLLRDVERYDICGGKTCVWPFKLLNGKQNICLVQAEFNKKVYGHFNKEKDSEKL